MKSEYVKRLEKVLRKTNEALKKAPPDALGIASARLSNWYVSEELVADIERVLENRDENGA